MHIYTCIWKDRVLFSCKYWYLGYNETSAITRTLARSRRSRYSRVPLYMYRIWNVKLQWLHLWMVLLLHSSLMGSLFFPLPYILSSCSILIHWISFSFPVLKTSAVFKTVDVSLGCCLFLFLCGFDYRSVVGRGDNSQTEEAGISHEWRFLNPWFSGDKIPCLSRWPYGSACTTHVLEGTQPLVVSWQGHCGLFS